MARKKPPADAPEPEPDQPEWRRPEDVTLHDLRHFGGTQTAISGATLRELQARLGHASPAAAMRYQHAAERRGREVADRLAAAWVDHHQPAEQNVRRIRRAEG
jgi:integrase